MAEQSGGFELGMNAEEMLKQLAEWRKIRRAVRQYIDHTAAEVAITTRQGIIERFQRAHPEWNIGTIRSETDAALARFHR